MSGPAVAVVVAVISLLGTIGVGWLTYRASDRASRRTKEAADDVRESDEQDREYQRLDALTVRLEAEINRLDARVQDQDEQLLRLRDRIQQLEEQGTRDARQIRLLRQYVGALVDFIDDTGPHTIPPPSAPTGLDL